MKRLRKQERIFLSWEKRWTTKAKRKTEIRKKMS